MTNKVQEGNQVVEESKLIDDFSKIQTKNEMAEVLKELFDEKKIYLIGDLSKDEIKLATRIYMIAEMKELELWKKGLAFFSKALLSKDRKSRKEILEAIKGYNANQGMLGRLNPRNWGGNRGM